MWAEFAGNAAWKKDTSVFGIADLMAESAGKQRLILRVKEPALQKMCQAGERRAKRRNRHVNPFRLKRVPIKVGIPHSGLHRHLHFGDHGRIKVEQGFLNRSGRSPVLSQNLAQKSNKCIDLIYVV